MTLDPLSKRVLWSTAVQVLARVFSLLVAFVVLVLLQRSVSKAEFGLYTYYWTAFSIGLTFVTFGGTVITVRELSAKRQSAKALVGAMMRFHALTSAVVGLGLVVFALQRESPEDPTLWFCLGVLIWIGNFMSAPVAYYQSRLEFGFPALASMGGSCVTLVLALIAIESDECRYEQVLMASVIGHGFQACIVTFAFWRRMGIEFTMPWRSFVGILRDMIPIGLAGIIGAIYMYVDTLMIRDLVSEESGLEAVAEYTAAFRVLSVSLLIPVFLGQAVFPLMASTAKASPAQFAGLLRRTMIVTSVLGISIAGSLQFLNVSVIEWLWDARMASSSSHLSSLSWAIALIYGSYPLVHAMNAAGRQGEFLRLAFVALVVNVALNVVMIPAMGVSGAAWSTVFTEALVFIVLFIRLQSLTYLVVEWKDLSKISVAFLLSLFSGYLLRDQSLVVVVISAAALGSLLFIQSGGLQMASDVKSLRNSSEARE